MSAPPISASISTPAPPICPYCDQPISADRGVITNTTVCGLCFKRLACDRCGGDGFDRDVASEVALDDPCRRCGGSGIDPDRCPEADRKGCDNPNCHDCNERAEWRAEDSRDLRAKAGGR